METTTGKVMTIEEIEREFDGEWVLVGDPDTDRELKVIRGQVLCHSKDRDDLDRCARTHRDGPFQRFAWLYNGEIPAGVAVLL